MAGMCGGISKTAVDDEKIKSLVNEALVQITNENEPHELIEILEAGQQVVAGMKYLIKVAVKTGDSERLIGDFEIWERVWVENGREVKFTLENGKVFNLKQSPK